MSKVVAVLPWRRRRWSVIKFIVIIRWWWAREWSVSKSPWGRCSPSLHLKPRILHNLWLEHVKAKDPVFSPTTWKFVTLKPF